MISTTSTLGVLGRFSIVVCLSLVIASCGFHLQGQSLRSFPPQLNLYVDDPVLKSLVASNLVEHGVVLTLVESVVGTDTKAPTLQLKRTLKNSTLR